MPTVTVEKAKNDFDALLMSVQNSFEPLRIAGDNCTAVIVSEEAWRSLEETIFLTSLPGMKESIIAGMKEDIQDCATELDW